MTALRVVLAPDLQEPLDALTADLAEAELSQARESGGGEQRQRHLVLGRLAARLAVRRVLGSPSLAVEILAGPDGLPLVRCRGAASVAVSISHSGRLAAACAWSAAGDGWAAGVDLERLRPTSVADSSYAFSLREQRLLARTPGGPALAGLAAWTAKEAAWKAAQHLAASPHLPPSWKLAASRKVTPSAAGLEIRSLDLRKGRAVVEVNAGTRAAVRTGLVQGPDGSYLLSIARLDGRGGRQKVECAGRN